MSPSLPPEAAAPPKTDGGGAATTSAPDAVFRINPAPDTTGVVQGGSPLEVTFNNCQTTDAEGDALAYKYDFLGNGTFERGRCRASYVYEAGSGRACYRPVVCAKDGGPDGTSCKTWDVCVSGAGGGEVGQPVATTTFESADVPVKIPDVSTVESSVLVSGVGGPVQNVTVSFHLTHTFDGDLDIFLIAPDGTSVELTTDNGGGGDNFGTSCSGRTTFDDAAAVSVVGQAAPFAGTFRPEGSLASLKGKAANGTWRLQITDDMGADVGSLFCWSVTITG
jgi:subtilisin-like proprotein convertase family protein